MPYMSWKNLSGTGRSMRRKFCLPRGGARGRLLFISAQSGGYRSEKTRVKENRKQESRRRTKRRRREEEEEEKKNKKKQKTKKKQKQKKETIWEGWLREGTGSWGLQQQYKKYVIHQTANGVEFIACMEVSA